MRRLMTYGVGLSLCLFYFKPLFLSYPDVPDQTRWEEAVVLHIEEVSSKLVNFHTQPTGANYDELRESWEMVSWLGYLTPQGEPAIWVDNNRAWLSTPSMADLDFPEAGLLQRLEYQATKVAQPAITADVGALHRYLDTLAQQAIAAHPSAAEVSFLLATELQRQYTLQLNGYFRLDRTAGIKDFRAFLSKLSGWQFLLAAPKALRLQQQCQAAIVVLDQSDFVALDRLSFFKNHVQPLYLTLTKDLPVAALSHQFGLAGNEKGNFFSSDWLAGLTPQVSRTKINLGRLLFFDPLLSANWKRSCASCHQPSKAFSDGRASSMAFDFPDRLTRNAPSIVNLPPTDQPTGFGLEHAGSGAFIQSVFDHPQELRIDISEILARLELSPDYQAHFREAFPNRGMDSTSVILALKAYIGNLVDTESEFDKLLAENTTEALEPVQRGYTLFSGKAGCINCHFPPYFSGLRPPRYQVREYHSLGINRRLFGRDLPDEDRGVGATRKDDRYDFFYRTPGLRNVTLTPPYAHNGSIVSLEDFINYLSDGNYADHASLPPGSLSFSEQEKAALLAFLKSLTGTIATREKAPTELPILVPTPESAQHRKAAGMY